MSLTCVPRNHVIDLSFTPSQPPRPSSKGADDSRLPVSPRPLASSLTSGERLRAATPADHAFPASYAALGEPYADAVMRGHRARPIRFPKRTQPRLTAFAPVVGSPSLVTVTQAYMAGPLLAQRRRVVRNPPSSRLPDPILTTPCRQADPAPLDHEPSCEVSVARGGR